MSPNIIEFASNIWWHYGLNGMVLSLQSPAKYQNSIIYNNFLPWIFSSFDTCQVLLLNFWRLQGNTLNITTLHSECTLSILWVSCEFTVEFTIESISSTNLIIFYLTFLISPLSVTLKHINVSISTSIQKVEVCTNEKSKDKRHLSQLRDY